jgi:tetratricopeptide (TPR) repeat protein
MLPWMVVTVALTAAAPAAWGQPGASASSAASSSSSQPSASASAEQKPALAPADLDRMLAPLAHDSVDDRRAAASALVTLGPDATDAIGQKLASIRRGGMNDVYNTMKSLRDRAKEGGFDLVEALVSAKPDAATQRTLTIACLVRGLAHAATTPAVRQLVALASDAGGTFRPELTRQMKTLGDHALAGLIEARHESSAETRTWASNLLEAMGKRTPGDAVQTKDNQVLADVLHAYADIKDLEALPVVLSFVNSDRAQVRVAAREATLAYGPDAVWKLRESYAALSGEQAPDGISAGELAKKLFDAYDRARLQEVYAMLDAGLAKQQAGSLSDAIHAFDQVLARQPMLDRRAEMSPAYASWGESLEDTDRPAALASLRKALRLDEAGPQSSHVRSEIRYLEGEDLLDHGIADTQPFEEAVALDPQNARARAALDRLRADTDAGRSRVHRYAAAAAALVLAVVGIVVLGGRRRRAKSATA